MKRFAKLWDFYFVGGVGFFFVTIALADQVAVPLVVLAFNAGVLLAHWVFGFQRDQLLEALRLTQQMAAIQSRFIDEFRKECEKQKG